MLSAGKISRHLACVVAAAGFGCAAKPKPAPPPKPEAPSAEVFKPYIPSTRPVAPVTEGPSIHPADAQPAMAFLYSIELWEVQLPRYSVSTDEAFWKRVDEQKLDLPSYDVLFKNGIRVGELPVSDLGAVRKLIEDRKGTRTTIQGTQGRQVQVPIDQNVPSEVIFYLNRSNDLIGRSYDRCDNFLTFSFETTPRDPDRIRLVFTPAVRGQERKTRYSATPGKPDREVTETVEEMHYDVGLAVDLPLLNALIVAPSVEARVSTSIGSRFLVIRTPSEERERFLVVIPHAYQRAADAPSQ